MTRFLGCSVILLIVTVLAGLMLSSTSAQAQSANQGKNAIWNSSGCCSPSSSFIDAEAVSSTGSDVCGKINAALALVSSRSSAVIDARGVTSLACPTGDTPWTYGAVTSTPPATILLPAGTITTNTPWILPNGTHLIGEGSGAVGASPTAITTIESSATTIIEMGSNSTTYCPLINSLYVCTGISVEDLVLDGGAGANNTAGIQNAYAQERSYVKQVALYRTLGTGIRISSVSGQGSAQNSGPYTDITFGTSTANPATASTVCAAVNGVTTRGVHGLHCTNVGSAPASGEAVLLGGSNNSFEDVSIQGFFEGIKIGSNGTAQGNILMNISADPWTGTASVTNAVIHIVAANPVTDTVILGVNKGGGTATSGPPYSIVDDITEEGSSTTKLTDISVAMYALGEKMTATGATNPFTRFTTSPNLPAWIRGSIAPTTGSCVTGSLYSNSGGAGTMANDDWYVCTPTNTWTPIM